MTQRGRREAARLRDAARRCDQPRLAIVLEIASAIATRLDWYDSRGHEAPAVTERAMDTAVEMLAAAVGRHTRDLSELLDMLGA